MIELGRYNELKILRETSVGLFLGDKEGNDVLLPNKYCPKKFEIGDIIEVFVYRDFAERIVATNLKPKLTLFEFALLKVMDVSPIGAFLDWGLEKELFVPFREQRMKMEEGRWYIVYLDLDEETDRLFGTNKIEKRLDNTELEVVEGEEVEILIYNKSDLGYTVIVNNIHKGLIYANEVFQELNIGDRMPAFVKKIREENKLDITLYKLGYKESIEPNTEEIYNILVQNKGYLAITDKSGPEEIYKHFGISKKAFKKALGALYKQHKVVIEEEGIRVV